MPKQYKVFTETELLEQAKVTNQSNSVTYQMVLNNLSGRGWQYDHSQIIKGKTVYVFSKHTQ